MASLRQLLKRIVGDQGNVGKPESKAVVSIDLINDDRGGLPKAYIPQFLLNAPFGYPRFLDVTNIRRLSATPFVSMAEDLIINMCTTVEFKIVPKDPNADPNTNPELKAHIEHVQKFFDNPNDNKESFAQLRKKVIRDILELDSGIIQKVFDKKGEMKQIIARDGGGFTKNPDEYGFLTKRADIIPDTMAYLFQQEFNLNQMSNPLTGRGSGNVAEKAAYFQYGWTQSTRPVPFGKREIVWLEMNPRTDSIYGCSPVEVLLSVIQLLVWSIESELEYYNNNIQVQGVVGLPGLDPKEVKTFQKQWTDQLLEKDSFGQWKRKSHPLPFLNVKPEFVRTQFTAQELDFIAQQQWFSKVAWAKLGVTPTELGFTENSNQSTDVNQSRVIRRRTINPILMTEQFFYNKEIISEFGYEDVEGKFDMFDVDEEKNKVDLYDKQIKIGIKTLNEIRTQEGDDPLPWGDDAPKSFMYSDNAQNINFNGGGQQGDQQERTPSRTRQNMEDEQNQGRQGKALTTNSPLVPGVGEKVKEPKPEKQLKKVLLSFLDASKEKLLTSLESATGQDMLSQIKSAEKKNVKDALDQLKALFAAVAIKSYVNNSVKEAFFDGMEEASQKADQNFIPNPEAIKFLQNHTFENVKGMTDEIANDLRQELERGVIAGEGIAQLKTRVLKVFDVGENRAKSIARTETNRAENVGNFLAWKQSGLKAKKYLIVTEDEKTSPICGAMDKKYGTMEDAIPLTKDFVVSAGGKLIDEPHPPFHVNCRTKLVAFTDFKKE